MLWDLEQADFLLGNVFVGSLGMRFPVHHHQRSSSVGFSLLSLVRAFDFQFQPSCRIHGLGLSATCP